MDLRPRRHRRFYNEELLMRTAMFFLCVLSASAVFGQGASEVKYKLRYEDLQYAYGAGSPVLTVAPGQIIDTNTTDADGKIAEAAGFKIKGPNPLTGPFYIKGAEPGDTLVVRFVTIETDHPEGWGTAGPGFGALNSSKYTPVLGGPIPNLTWTYPIDRRTQTATFRAKDSAFSVKIPLHPFLGCIGVAPAAEERRSSIVPAENGGNMDAPEASVGNTLFLPVNVPGALLYLGDGHAAMGDGEIDGTAIETGMHVRIQVDLIKHKPLSWPRFENPDYLMGVGIYRPLDDALRIAFTELVRWMHDDYGLSEMDSYELLSKVAEIHLDEMVDPNYVVVAKVKKSFLPPRRSASKP
jgi:acetamidase/formamidase